MARSTQPPIVLRLRPSPTEYKIKVKRREASSPSGEGLKIKLKGRWQSRKEEGDSSPGVKETIRKFFIPDRDLLSESDLERYVLRVQLDEQGQMLKVR